MSENSANEFNQMLEDHLAVRFNFHDDKAASELRRLRSALALSLGALKILNTEGKADEVIKLIEEIVFPF